MLSQKTTPTKVNIVPVINIFLDMDKLFSNSIHNNWYAISIATTLSIICLSKLLSAYPKFSSIQNHMVHSTQTYGPLQHTIPNSATYVHPHRQMYSPSYRGIPASFPTTLTYFLLCIDPHLHTCTHLIYIYILTHIQ